MREEDAIATVEESAEERNIPKTEIESDGEEVKIKTEYNDTEIDGEVKFRGIDKPDFMLRLDSTMGRIQEAVNTQKYIENRVNNE